MLAALAASGQTPSAFARAKGFGPYRVSYWRARLAERGGVPARSDESGFVAVTVRGESSPRTDAVDRRIEVALPNGRLVTFAGTWDPTSIGPWLQALEGTR